MATPNAELASKLQARSQRIIAGTSIADPREGRNTGPHALAHDHLSDFKRAHAASVAVEPVYESSAAPPLIKSAPIAGLATATTISWLWVPEEAPAPPSTSATDKAANQAAAGTATATGAAPVSAPIPTTVSVPVFKLEHYASGLTSLLSSWSATAGKRIRC
jgi:hypothetical protein